MLLECTTAETLLIRFLKYRLSIHLHISLLAGVCISAPLQAAPTTTRAITTEVYDHDFLIFDGHTISEGITIRFHLEPEPLTLHQDAIEIQGNHIIYKEELKPNQTVAGYLKGYSTIAADYHFTVEDTKTKVGVEQSSDSPISRFYLWSMRTTVSPEACIHLDVASGKTGDRKINYRFFAPPAQP